MNQFPSSTNSPCTPLDPRAVSEWVAIEVNGISPEKFSEWEFDGYDEYGHECRIPPEEVTLSYLLLDGEYNTPDLRDMSTRRP